VTDGVLDTAFFIDLKAGDAGAERVWHLIRNGALSACFSPITTFELWVDANMDADEATFYSDAFNSLEEALLTSGSARQAGIWLRGYDRATRASRLRDALIAATASERNEPVYTRNVRDFRRFGVRVETY
jgi:predicted nucleic acid-binding protein